MRLTNLIPSMFQRRLLFLVAAMGVCALVPLAQMGRLTIAKADQLRVEAEKRLVSEMWIDSSRARILDRKGRELAVDRPSLDVAVDYRVITGRWATDMARKFAKKAKGPGAGPATEEEIAAARKKYDEHLKSMWALFAQTAGVSEEAVADKKNEIIEQVRYWSALVTERERKKEEARRRKSGVEGEVPTAAIKVTIQEQKQPHVLLRGVSDDVGIAFDRLKDQTAEDDDLGISAGTPLRVMPGLHVVDASRREYPYDVMDVEVDTSVFPPPIRGGTRSVRVPGVGMHLIGRMRSKLYKEDLDRRPRIDPATGRVDRGHYRPGDAVGHGGVEQAMEDTLRGLRGVRTKHLDTGEEEITGREPGRDVNLTIDIALQARIQALFDPSLGLAVVQPWHRAHHDDEAPKPDAPKDLPIGTPLNGAVVVIDVATNEVLAMVSVPSFSHEQIEKMPETVQNDPYNQAFLDRAIAKPYPPGSIVKPLVLCEAVREGRYDTAERINCTGHFFPDKPLLYRCWIYKQFHTTHTARLGHELDGADGIKCSCNIFFFEMGKRLGVQGIHDLYTWYGVGADAEPFNIFNLAPLPSGTGDGEERKAELARRALLHESAGEVKKPSRATTQEAILMGIGQGPVTWTPMHAANAYAALARRGVFMKPRIYADGSGAATGETGRDMGIPGRAVDQALKGLHGSANEDNGTTHVVTYDMPDGTRKQEDVFTVTKHGVSIWAKSGTADTAPFNSSLGQEDGRDELYDSDHAWCVCLAGVGNEPRYAIACVLDYGGSGGRVSGPLANQVVFALMAEGYLPR